MKISKPLSREEGTEHIFREFFIGHQFTYIIISLIFLYSRDPIIYISSFNQFSEIITVDESGLIFIWRYSKEAFYPKYHGFSPVAKMTYCLCLESIFFLLSVNPHTVGYKEAGQKILIYPSKTKKLSSQDSKRYFNVLMDTKELDQKLVKKSYVDEKTFVIIKKFF